jgi:hypothetical protein
VVFCKEGSAQEEVVVCIGVVFLGGAVRLYATRTTSWRKQQQSCEFDTEPNGTTAFALMWIEEAVHGFCDYCNAICDRILVHKENKKHKRDE